MSKEIKPIVFAWTGEVMQPISPQMEKICDEQYIVGERYYLTEYEDRSAKSHNHYFAALATAHENLPDKLFEQFPTVEHLRKYALIKTGYYDSRSIVVAFPSDAKRLVTFLKPIDEFSIVLAIDNVITVFKARSQSKNSMTPKIFKESKDAVLSFVANLIGLNKDNLSQNINTAR